MLKRKKKVRKKSIKHQSEKMFLHSPPKNVNSYLPSCFTDVGRNG